jgi:hypothetical protein
MHFVSSCSCLTFIFFQKENVDEDILSLGHGPHKVEIDLMQPIDPTKSPKVQTPALNHLGLWVDHLEKAVESLTAQGVNFTPGGIRKGAGILPFLYVLHTFLDCFLFFSLDVRATGAFFLVLSQLAIMLHLFIRNQLVVY